MNFIGDSPSEWKTTFLLDSIFSKVNLKLCLVSFKLIKTNSSGSGSLKENNKKKLGELIIASLDTNYPKFKFNWVFPVNSIVYYPLFLSIRTPSTINLFDPFLVVISFNEVISSVGSKKKSIYWLFPFWMAFNKLGLWIYYKRKLNPFAFPTIHPFSFRGSDPIEKHPKSNFNFFLNWKDG